jgi:hypothetical protein
VEGLEKDRGDKEPQATAKEGGGKHGGDQGSPALQQTMENEDGNRSATREGTQVEEFNGKEEFTDEDDEDENLDDQEDDDDDGDDQFPPIKELEDLDEDRELRIAVAAVALGLSGNGDVQIGTFIYFFVEISWIL